MQAGMSAIGPSVGLMGTSEPSPAVTLAPSPPAERQSEVQAIAGRQLVAASQASLNEIVATIIRAASGDRELITMALRALREHNWASGFAFEGARAPYDHLAPAAYRESAVLAVRVIQAKKDVDAARARAMACTYEHVLPPDAAGPYALAEG